MRKTLIALIATGLLLTSSVSANASVKDGATCTTKNKVTVVRNASFKCTLVGKKLIWKKVQKPVVPPASPSPSATPVADPYPLMGKAKEAVSLTNLPYAETALKARAEVLRALAAIPAVDFKPTITGAPGVIQDRMAEQLLGLNDAIRLWSPYFIPKKYDIVYFSSNTDDKSWIQDTLTKVGAANGISIVEQITATQPANFCTWGNAFNSQVFIQCLGAGYGAVDRQTAPHEFTHSFQQNYGTVGSDYPCWIVEGMASYYGGALGYRSDADYLALSAKRYGNFLAGWGDSHGGVHGVIDTQLATGTYEDFLKVMREVESPHGIACMPIGAGAYMFGGLATEVLVANYGHDAVAKWIIRTGKDKDWRKAFSDSFGMDLEEFYRHLYPYVHDWVVVSSQFLQR